ncbi:Spy/CpxP family protein refolding chaperone [Methylocapsa sp. D3K7]|uniref:Spy/CpxP family protein refolding chaperone n=1 Tax=Methylocapsa sp. D3K7 TaxID=3041435 RepID=UPI00244EB965|nr:Spy/CpxP family protein refolding chaperone [Methylocapsa sp. D3K7]WGJ14352.1 Spy/CpxP family protein refolding chaperone [Methylocapsa sp. D3K7]
MHPKNYFLLAGLGLSSSILGLVSSGTTLAGTAPVPRSGSFPPAAEKLQKFCADEDALFKAKMAFTEAKLDLQPSQRPNWDSFVAESSAAVPAIRSVCDEAPPAGNDTVAELDFHQRGLAAFFEADRALTAAAKKFSVALTSDQKRTLADSVIHPLPLFPPFGPPGPPL